MCNINERPLLPPPKGCWCKWSLNHTLKAFLQVLFPRAESTCAYLEAVLVARSPFLLPEAPQTQVTWFRSVSEGWSRPLESAHPGSELASRPLSSRASRGAMHFSLRCARPQAGAGAPEKGQRKEKARTAWGGAYSGDLRCTGSPRVRGLAREEGYWPPRPLPVLSAEPPVGDAHC